TGIDKLFLTGELKNAQEALVTPDCFSLCSGCGINCKPHSKEDRQNHQYKITIEDRQNFTDTQYEGATKKITFRYGKYGDSRYIGHLDTMNIMLRAFRALGINLEMHGRYHPIPKIALSDALPVGIESTCELIEIEIKDDKKISIELIRAINRFLPRGIKIYEFYRDSLKNIKKEYTYILVANRDDIQEGLKPLIKRNGRVFYSVKTNKIKQYLQGNEFERIIKVEDKRIYGIRVDN
ncbi:MAG: TIGR03936 family radical SAM-associated protein, partial [Syntrophorhabdaceae bacterium]|nr:TIGR03936 family radical SAM-associated protein [Syntrophorhabdaceae bacterium]